MKSLTKYMGCILGKHMGLPLLFILFSVQTGFALTEKYRLAFTTDPSTAITVGWNQLSGNDAVVHYDIIDHGSNASDYAFSKTVDRTVAYRGMNNKFARLSGLTPNKKYYFVLQDNEGVSERFWFMTAPSDDTPISFIAGGDSRNNQTVRRDANTLVSKLKPTAVLFGGDMISTDNESEWKVWFDDWQYTTSDDGRMIPIVPTLGNHENFNSIYKLFDVTEDSTFYALSFGTLVRTYTLNSNMSVTGAQKTWLKNDLIAHTAPNPEPRWKIAQYHHPMLPHTKGKGDRVAQYTDWAPLFYDYHVRLAVECDAHLAKTTWPIKPSSEAGNDEGFIREDAFGTVYVGEGAWGAPLRPADDNKAWTRASGSFNQFKIIFVTKDKMDLRTIKIENVANVGAVTNEDPFTLPENLVVWNPPTGDVVEILQPGVVLPVSLVDFRVEKIDNTKALLNWTTAVETNNSYFEIQRSKDGRHFSTIGKVEGQGNSLISQNYKFLDDAPLSGNNYYRLKQVDYDGAFTFSEIKIITISNPIWAIFPNPTSGELFIRLATEPEDGIIRIYNAQGQVVLVQKLRSDESLTSLNIGHLNRGIYAMVVQINGKSVVEQLVVR